MRKVQHPLAIKNKPDNQQLAGGGLLRCVLLRVDSSRRQTADGFIFSPEWSLALIGNASAQSFQEDELNPRRFRYDNFHGRRQGVSRRRMPMLD
jgi:hypothetical protein